jgi:hypothetical protein
MEQGTSSSSSHKAHKGISSEQRSFVISEDGPDKETEKFDDFRGTGVPPADLGSLGDTYIDTKASELYARCSDGWRKWPGPKFRRSAIAPGQTPPLAHPNRPELFLWCSVAKNKVMWLRESKMKKICESFSSFISGMTYADW